MVNIQGVLGAEALRILRMMPGLAVVAEPAGEEHGVDAIVRFAGKRTPVAVEFKQRVNAATAWGLVHRAKARSNTRLLVIAGETTAEARTILEEHGIAVLDGLGNAHIELPGLLFHLEGRNRSRQSGATFPAVRLQGKAGVVAQALLCSPGRAWKVKDLADNAQVSAALAHRVLKRLEDEEIVEVKGTGPKRVRSIANATALLDLWAEENVERPIRTLAYVLAQTPQQLIKELGGNLERGGIDYALTGAAAASLVAPFLTTVPVIETWVKATTAHDEICDAVGADPVKEGNNIVFLQAKDDAPLVFREKVEGLWVVNRFRLYADLRRDPRRGREQANHLRKEVIGF